jgi:hypothetical protein
LQLQKDQLEVTVTQTKKWAEKRFKIIEIAKINYQLKT